MGECLLCSKFSPGEYLLYSNVSGGKVYYIANILRGNVYYAEGLLYDTGAIAPFSPHSHISPLPGYAGKWLYSRFPLRKNGYIAISPPLANRGDNGYIVVFPLKLCWDIKTK